MLTQKKTTLDWIVNGSLFKFLLRIIEGQLLGVVEEESAKGAVARTTFGKDGLVPTADYRWDCIYNELMKGLLIRSQGSCKHSGFNYAIMPVANVVHSGLVTVERYTVSSAAKVLPALVEEAGLAPTTEPYDALVRLYGKRSDLEGAFLLCRQMESHDELVPNDTTYKALMRACMSKNESITKWECGTKWRSLREMELCCLQIEGAVCQRLWSIWKPVEARYDMNTSMPDVRSFVPRKARKV
ncbi:hypothetical protein BAE44_0024327 [Dichanthelium oligosanthes]|uniref:Pentatricopeptide repeat-containing protein n=1 Tax=Dichanthelium oligosanthes TaxID=888268 RepID=A0A1E5UP66_9POAL|nr:hypothetical protein BAE44_0024327 [Dichanthelium oligosanthes]